MQIESLKELQKLIKACRALGVEKIEIDGIKLELGALPRKEVKSSPVNETLDFNIDGIGPNMPVPPPEIDIKTDGLTQEQLMFYSSESVEPVEA